jgi:hypothetical protein
VSGARRRGNRDNCGSFREALQESDGRLNDSAHHGPYVTGFGYGPSLLVGSSRR